MDTVIKPILCVVFTFKRHHMNRQNWFPAFTVLFFSVGVDIRKGSDTFGQYVGEVLSFENRKIMYVPKGFAHGYLTLEDDVLMQWCIDGGFKKEAACVLRYDDPDVGIEWPKLNNKLIISDKDIEGMELKRI